MRQREPRRIQLFPWVLVLGMGLVACRAGAAGGIVLVGLAVAGLLLAVR